MTKVKQEARAAGKPQLNPAATGGADSLLATIAKVEFRESQFKKYEQPVLTFEEFPEHELRVGKRGTDRLCQKFGDESDEWIGEQIPLVKNREEVGNKTYVVYGVAPIEEWGVLIKQARKATKVRK